MRFVPNVFKRAIIFIHVANSDLSDKQKAYDVDLYHNFMLFPLTSINTFVINVFFIVIKSAQQSR